MGKIENVDFRDINEQYKKCQLRNKQALVKRLKELSEEFPELSIEINDSPGMCDTCDSFNCLGCDTHGISHIRKKI